MHEWLPHEPSLHYELNSGDKQTFLCAENKWNPCFFSNTQDLGKKKMLKEQSRTSGAENSKNTC